MLTQRSKMTAALALGVTFDREVAEAGRRRQALEVELDLGEAAGGRRRAPSAGRAPACRRCTGRGRSRRPGGPPPSARPMANGPVPVQRRAEGQHVHAMADEIWPPVHRACARHRNADHDIARVRQPADHDLQRGEQRREERRAVGRRGLAQGGEKRRIDRRACGSRRHGPAAAGAAGPSAAPAGGEMSR